MNWTRFSLLKFDELVNLSGANGRNLLSTLENLSPKELPQHELAIVKYGNFATLLLVTLLLVILIGGKKLREWLENKNRLEESEGYGARKEISRLKGIPKVSHFYGIPLPTFVEGGITLYKFKNEGFKLFETYAAKYGRLYDIPVATGVVTIISDPDIIQKVLCSTEHFLAKPKHLYDRVFTEWFTDGLISSNVELWKPHRKILNRCFTYKAFRNYIPFMNTHAKDLVKKLQLNCDHTGEITGKKLFDLMYLVKIRITAQVLMGFDLHNEEESTRFHENMNIFKILCTDLIMKPEFRIKPYWWLHPRRIQYNRIVSEVTAYIEKRIAGFKLKYEAERLASADGESKGQSLDEKIQLADDADMVGKPFRCMIEEMLHFDLSTKEIFDEIGTFMSAGHETTTTAIQLVMQQLALNPDHQQLCCEELDDILNLKCQQENKDKYDLTLEDMKNLKHLERCILETMRLAPAIPIFLRQTDVPLKINDDLVFEANRTLCFVPYVVHRDPDYFPDPETFDPDRFLPENIKGRHSTAYFAFSAGPRDCIGRKFALLEMKTIIAWIIRHFAIFTRDGPNDVSLHFGVTITPKRDYDLYLRKRKK